MKSLPVYSEGLRGVEALGARMAMYIIASAVDDYRSRNPRSGQDPKLSQHNHDRFIGFGRNLQVGRTLE